MNSRQREKDPDADAAPAADSPLPAWPNTVKFEELARCGNEVWIDFRGQVYRLRRTRQGKLILTK